MLVHLNYVKQRFDILRVLLVSDGRIARHKHLKRAGKQPRPRRFWVRPGRTSLWWDNFISRKVVEEEWRENFRMSRVSLYRLADQLRPHIPDTCGRGDSIRIRRCMDTETFKSEKEKSTDSKVSGYVWTRPQRETLLRKNITMIT